MLRKLMFRLLPIQVLLAAVGAVNGIVSSYFASNFVGVEAMSAVGLYSPINMLMTAISAILVGGAAILCGKHMGQNRQEKVQNVFALNLALAALIAIVFMGVFAVLGFFDLTVFLTRNLTVRPIFNRYLLGQAIGLIPFMLGNSFASFLLLENKWKRTLCASLVYIAINVLLNFLFVRQLHMEAFGLALATSLGMWVFFAMQAQYYLSGKSFLKFSFRNLEWKESLEIVKIGLPGAASNVYQTVRGLIVNNLIEIFVGNVGISALAASDNLLRIFWSVPIGMLAVSRLVISVSVGEEDRKTLADAMRVMFRWYLPLMGCICALIIFFAQPLTSIFYKDPSAEVYVLTMWGLRILPLCMPLSIICMHFTCYGQASNKQGLVHVLALLDGVVCVAGFTALLIPFIGMNSVYIANVLNGVVTTLVIIGYACLKNKAFPRNMEQLMVIPEDFGAAEDERVDVSVRSMEEVVTVAEQIQKFCLGRGIDERHAMLAGLSMEEMAANIVQNLFPRDKKEHSVEVRVVHKEDDIILRIKDDCVPFDPAEQLKMVGDSDVDENLGIRMVFKIAKEVQYQNVLGLNVLTLHIDPGAAAPAVATAGR